MVSHLLLCYCGLDVRYRVIYVLSRYVWAERNHDPQRSKKYDSTMNAPGRKCLMLDTPDRESNAPKRRLIPTSRGTQGVPPEMVSQIAIFRLVGSPKRKAHKPQKIAQVGKGKYFCVSLKES